MLRFTSAWVRSYNWQQHPTCQREWSGVRSVRGGKPELGQLVSAEAHTALDLLPNLPSFIRREGESQSLNRRRLDFFGLSRWRADCADVVLQLDLGTCSRWRHVGAPRCSICANPEARVEDGRVARECVDDSKDPNLPSGSLVMNEIHRPGLVQLRCGTAINSTSVTSCAVMAALIDQPTTRRESRSITDAT